MRLFNYIFHHHNVDQILRISIDLYLNIKDWNIIINLSPKIHILINFMINVKD